MHETTEQKKAVLEELTSPRVFRQDDGQFSDRRF